METVSILGKDTIVVGQGLLEYIVKDILRSVTASSLIIVTDENIARYHLHPFINALNHHIAQITTTASSNASKDPPRVLHYIMPPGEAAKTRSTKQRIEDYALANKCTRDSCFIALGGGVIGDLVGFVAATFMRGCPFIQVPTTLLAMVDSSIGGKTGVDTQHGKNLIGAFHQPVRVYIDLMYLKTLPMREFVNGLGEVIKTACIWSDSDFLLLENHPEKILALHTSTTDTNTTDTALLLRVILGSVRVKAHVVTHDEKESGLRGLLNFGHTIGHAYEAILTPDMLHGECVAIGMVREAEIARHLGYCNDITVGRLVRCLQAYGLPTSVGDAIVKQRVGSKVCPVDDLLDIMKVDKKNEGKTKKMVMLAGIGKTVEPRAMAVQDDVIRKILSPAIMIVPSPSASKTASPRHIKINVPGSKSISNRALVLAALGSGTCRLKGLLHSDDVQVMLDALQKLVGMEFEWEDGGETLVVMGGKGKLSVPKTEIYLGNAGTAARFLTGVCALIPKPSSPSSDTTPQETCTIVTGNARMKQRPIGPLVAALRANSVSIEYLGNEGCLPLKITPQNGLQGGRISLSATISSQYVSSILLSAPYAKSPVTLDLGQGKVISQPYIDMTIAMMQDFGIHVVRDPGTNVYHVPQGVYVNPPVYAVEADASSATYPLAYAAVAGDGCTVTVTNIGRKSLQGDAGFVQVLKAMGCVVDQTDGETTVTGPITSKRECLKGVSVDMETMTDAFLTASVVGACAAPGSVTRITGIANQRVKECNRIAVMVEQLALFGVRAQELEDGIEVFGVGVDGLCVPPGGVKCYDDHRVAMSFSLLACAIRAANASNGGEGAVIKEKKCVEKTWPGWWDALSNILGVTCVGVDLEDHHEHASENRTALADDSAHHCDTLPLILIGMRGAGKTHLGRVASTYLCRPLIDMDDYFCHHTGGQEIQAYVSQHGWAAFRDLETQLFENVLKENASAGVVISCGGGLVETPRARQVLETLTREGGACVVHVRRDIGEIEKTLERERGSRAVLGEGVRDIWERRRVWFEQVSGFEFWSVNEQNQQNETKGVWEKVDSDFRRFLGVVMMPQPAGGAHSVVPRFDPTGKSASWFLSLTCGNVQDVEKDLEVLVAGCSAVELRVDLLTACDEEFVGQQVVRARRAGVPVIFTVRTRGQGGKFDGSAEERRRLVKKGVQWGCEYVDVESEDLKAVSEWRGQEGKGVGKTVVIGSWHDVKQEAVWVVNDDNVDKITFRSKYDEMKDHCDIVKLIGVATCMQDNFDVQTFMDSLIQATKGTTVQKPVIALNMSAVGTLSRVVVNTFMTPVTHPRLPTSAAPGQVSVREINLIRSSLGLLKPKKFYLFGKPIGQSPSPAMHNAGFDALGVPFTYEKCETDDWREVKRVVERDVASGVFGGASVTIPLKEDIVSGGVVQGDEGVKSVGSCNTVYVRDGRVVGGNTDWVGIKRCLEKRLVSGVRGGKKVGVVVGAGGTARAAVWALTRMGWSVYVWNRTGEKAHKMVREMQPHVGSGSVVSVVDGFEDAMIGASRDDDVVVVSTVPMGAHGGLEPLIDGLLTRRGTSSGAAEGKGQSVLVDMAYSPRERTALVTRATHAGWECVEGLEVLVEQGVEQFQIWMRSVGVGGGSACVGVPRREMEAGVEKFVTNR
ncbi:3-dehydroquinate dehydratase (3-dehydroquinase) [Gaertneriomyces sp. JEL0708]|nr:3-dehydroquinate dehydratase (3-dehydroquinase) [Gaertneriomyces sp. JEL0708]